MTNKINLKNRKGVSTVVATLLIVLLTVVLAGIVWGVVNNLVKDELEGSSSCFEVFGKITLNDRYTCYNSSSNEFHFSISQGNVEVEEVLVAIAVGGETLSIRLTNENQSFSDLRLFNNSYGTNNIIIPGKNRGFTYVYNLTSPGFSEKPDAIDIAPIANGNQCESSESIQQIDNCLTI